MSGVVYLIGSIDGAGVINVYNRSGWSTMMVGNGQNMNVIVSAVIVMYCQCKSNKLKLKIEIENQIIEKKKNLNNLTWTAISAVRSFVDHIGYTVFGKQMTIMSDLKTNTALLYHLLAE